MTLGPLTFLAPVPGLIAAAIAFPAVLLWYFLKLRRRPVRVSSTFLWNAAAADLQVNVPFRWIRPSWLLLLQLLIVAALVAAIARPAVEGAGGEGSRIVLLIDRSASMSALDGEPERDGTRRTRLDEAKDRARRVIDRLGGGAQAMVVTFAARPEALTNLTRDRGQIRAALDAITPADQPADLTAALRLLANTVGRAEDETQAPARVVLISDGAFDARTEPTGLGRAEFQFVRVGPPAPVAPAVVEPGAAAPPPVSAGRDNLGLVALAARRSFDDPATVELFYRVQNAGDAPAQSVVSVTLRGTVVDSRGVTVPARTADGPGELSQRIALQDAEGGVVVVSLARADLLPADNSAGLVLQPPDAPAILLVQPNVPAAVLDFLPIDALQSIGPRLLRVVTAAEYERLASTAPASAAPGSSATPAGLLEFDLVVFDRVRPSALPPIASLSFGASVPIPGLTATRPAEGDPAGAPTGVAFWQRSHPVLRYVNLGAVMIAAPMVMGVPDETATADGPPTQTQVLASGASGPLMVLAERAGVRRIVVGFELASSQWWQDPGFPVFIQNAVDFLTMSGNEAAGRALTTTQTIALRPLADAAQVQIAGPANSQIDRPQDGWDGPVTVGPLALAGLYEAAGVIDTDAAIAVNLLDPFESRLESADAVSLGGQQIVSSTAGIGGLREVWRWFVLAAAALLALEWAIYVWRMKV